MEETNVAHIEVFRDAGDQFRWRAVAHNGEVVSQGEAHTREHDAARAAQGVFGQDVVIVRKFDPAEPALNVVRDSADAEFPT